MVGQEQLVSELGEKQKTLEAKKRESQARTQGRAGVSGAQQKQRERGWAGDTGNIRFSKEFPRSKLKKINALQPQFVNSCLEQIRQ